MFAWLFHLAARARHKAPVAAPQNPVAPIAALSHASSVPVLIPLAAVQAAAANFSTAQTATTKANEISSVSGNSGQETATPAPPEIQHQAVPAKAEESAMATAPVTPAPTENGFERFIDKLESFVSAELPVATEVAVAAEPILALTPIGPEYALVVTAIAAAEKASAAFRSKTGVSLTGTQKMSLVVQAAAPTLTATLSAAGVTDTAIPTAIGQFAQNVYNFQTGPAATPNLAPAPPA